MDMLFPRIYPVCRSQKPRLIEESVLRKVREDPKTGFYVECQEVVVTNDDMIYAMLDAGNQLRTVGATNMNAQSSRSHAIFRLVLESSPKEGVEQEGTAEENAFRSSVR